MELDDLKATWQSDSQRHAQLKNMQEIKAILEGKAADMITSIKRKYQKMISSMLIGMLLTVVVFAFISDGFTYPGSINGFAKGMFFFALLIVFIWEKLKAVGNLELSDEIKERLEQMLGMLQKNLRIELTFTLLFFAGFILTGRFFYGRGLNGIFNTDVIVAFLLSLISIAVITFLIIRYRKKQINELKGYLLEYDTAV